MRATFTRAVTGAHPPHSGFLNRAEQTGSRARNSQVAESLS
jgi:hypothetical protein